MRSLLGELLVLLGLHLSPFGYQAGKGQAKQELVVCSASLSVANATGPTRRPSDQATNERSWQAEEES